MLSGLWSPSHLWHLLEPVSSLQYYINPLILLDNSIFLINDLLQLSVLSQDLLYVLMVVILTLLEVPVVLLFLLETRVFVVLSLREVVLVMGDAGVCALELLLGEGLSVAVLVYHFDGALVGYQLIGYFVAIAALFQVLFELLFNSLFHQLFVPHQLLQLGLHSLSELLLFNLFYLHFSVRVIALGVDQHHLSRRVIA